MFCADQYVSHLWDALTEAGLEPKRVFTWRKPNAVPINRKYIPMSACEYIVTGYKPGKNKVFNADIELDDQEAISEIGSHIIADKVAAVVFAEVHRRVRDLSNTGSHFPASVAAAIEDTLATITQEAITRVNGMFKDKDGGQYLQACIPNYVQYNSKGGKRIHSTEKPEALLRFFVATYSRPGDLVLDPFGGSGAHAAAAVSLGRNAVIVERDDEYFSKMTERLGATYETTN